MLMGSICLLMISMVAQFLAACPKDSLTSQQDMNPEEKKSYKNLNNLNYILDFITLKHKCSSLKKLCKTGHSSGRIFFFFRKVQFLVGLKFHHLQ